MKVISTVEEMQGIVNSLHSKGKKIGLVPTMGYLHKGHLSLVEEAHKRSDTVVMSIYVNPMQFGKREDLDTYPRDLDRDGKIASEHAVEFIFAPSDEEMYPKGYVTSVEVDKISHLFEGEFRPGHFKGVTTVVAKLFNITKPHVAVFGQKDIQQVFIIRKMVSDLNFDIEIVVAPIIREHDGLALSSRNVNLSREHRRQANVLYRSLKLAQSRVESGETSLVRVRTEMVKVISRESSGKLDYISFVNPDTFQKIEEVGALPEVLALMAVRFGQTRLIDNMLLKAGKL